MEVVSGGIRRAETQKQTQMFKYLKAMINQSTPQ